MPRELEDTEFLSDDCEAYNHLTCDEPDCCNCGCHEEDDDEEDNDEEEE